ncbi:aspartate/glutamate racemase family protein [Protaetiibacter intestinalis]|uniref:aspartate/glutamate racemase family protein n=1 Tax=Protaetiibacter intestinalis TaxID=2419774 RepID=UPI001300360F|nr:aspartate/glutamate racemase family protein [Protaetiibacter intestinalis]
MTPQRLVPGIIGFAPATDAVYLRELHAAVPTAQLGTVNTLRSVTASLDTDAFFALDVAGRKAEAEALILAVARSLRAAGADFLVVTSNTGSIILEGAAEQVLPILDIFAATVDAAVDAGFARPGLLSTARTAASGRYHAAADRRGAVVSTPPRARIAGIDALIGREAIRGVQTPESLRVLQDAVDELAAAGADSVILGCTDLVLYGPDRIGHGVLPVVDSTHAHARAAARLALGGSAS